MGCLTSFGCHNQSLGLGTNAPAWSYGGTLYKDASGTVPFPGATVMITVGTKTQKVVTADNGNFWLTPDDMASPNASSQAAVKVSGCPDTMEMTDKLADGNCNNCHRSGGTTTPIELTAEM